MIGKRLRDPIRVAPLADGAGVMLDRIVELRVRDEENLEVRRNTTLDIGEDLAISLSRHGLAPWEIADLARGMIAVLARSGPRRSFEDRRDQAKAYQQLEELFVAYKRWNNGDGDLETFADWLKDATLLGLKTSGVAESNMAASGVPISRPEDSAGDPGTEVGGAIPPVASTVDAFDPRQASGVRPSREPTATSVLAQPEEPPLTSESESGGESDRKAFRHSRASDSPVLPTRGDMAAPTREASLGTSAPGAAKRGGGSEEPGIFFAHCGLPEKGCMWFVEGDCRCKCCSPAIHVTIEVARARVTLCEPCLKTGIMHYAIPDATGWPCDRVRADEREACGWTVARVAEEAEPLGNVSNAAEWLVDAAQRIRARGGK